MSIFARVLAPGFPQTQTVYWPEPRVIRREGRDDDIYINPDIIERGINPNSCQYSLVARGCNGPSHRQHPPLPPSDKYCVGGEAINWDKVIHNAHKGEHFSMDLSFLAPIQILVFIVYSSQLFSFPL